MKRSEIHVGMFAEVLNPDDYNIEHRTRAGLAVVLITERYDSSCYVEICKEKYGQLMSTRYDREIQYKDLKAYKKIHGTKWWT